MHFGDKVKALAAERNMRQVDVVEKCNLSKSHVNAIWKNGVADPRLETMVELCKAFGITLDELAVDVDPDAGKETVEYTVVDLGGDDGAQG